MDTNLTAEQKKQASAVAKGFIAQAMLIRGCTADVAQGLYKRACALAKQAAVRQDRVRETIREHIKQATQAPAAK